MNNEVYSYILAKATDLMQLCVAMLPESENKIKAQRQLTNCIAYINAAVADATEDTSPNEGNKEASEE